mgnify:CR=1 FL=1
MPQIKLIETRRAFDLGDHESVVMTIQAAPEPGDDVEAVMENAIDKMEASAKRKYGGAILRKKKEKENE